MSAADSTAPKPDSAHAGTISLTIRVRQARWNAMKPRIQCALTQWKPGSMTSVRRPARTEAQDSFSNTATWLSLSEVKGARSQPAQRSRSRKPVILAMRSSSDGQTYR